MNNLAANARGREITRQCAVAVPAGLLNQDNVTLACVP